MQRRNRAERPGRRAADRRRHRTTTDAVWRRRLGCGLESDDAFGQDGRTVHRAARPVVRRTLLSFPFFRPDSSFSRLSDSGPNPQDPLCPRLCSAGRMPRPAWLDRLAAVESGVSETDRGAVCDKRKWQRGTTLDKKGDLSVLCRLPLSLPPWSDSGSRRRKCPCAASVLWLGRKRRVGLYRPEHRRRIDRSAGGSMPRRIEVPGPPAWPARRARPLPAEPGV